MVLVILVLVTELIQIANENGGGYLSGKEDIISSFSGIYPKSNPQVIIYASVARPSGGSQKPVSNAVKEVVRNISKYYGNSDSMQATIDINNYEVPNFTNKKTEVSKILLESSGMRYTIIGNGDKVVRQSPDMGDVITNQDSVFLITNDANLVVPNVVGYSGKIAKDLLQKMGLIVHLEGVGYVTNQSVGEGVPISNGMEITLQLNPKFTAE